MGGVLIDWQCDRVLHGTFNRRTDAPVLGEHKGRLPPHPRRAAGDHEYAAPDVGGVALGHLLGRRR